MTTDLTGDFELGEDEFDWDVFLPDPDEAEIAAEAAALEDEAELNLDDSDFDWETALGQDSGTENDGDDGARAGAAYDRIVDTVRRSSEDDEPEAVTVSEPVAVLEPETPVTVEPEPAAEPRVAAFEADREPDTELDQAVSAEPDADLEPDDPPAPALTLARGADEAWGGQPERESALLSLAERDLEADLTPEPSVMPEFEPDFEEEPAMAPFAETAASTGALGAMASPPSPDPRPTWAMAPAQPWEVGRHADLASDFFDAPLEDEGEGEPKRRSRIFTVTVALACMFLVIVAAAVAVRSLHHSTTPPPSAARSAPDASTSSAASSGTARIQVATDAVDSATTAASVGLTSLAAFPTPTNVETVINPYISSLQLYQAFLSGAKVPAAAQPAAASAEAQLRQNLQFLDTIDGLPPQQLGAYLVRFDSDATRLQTTLSTLEQNLRAPAS
ncbi:MAG TPA: hypothetical protein VHX67_07870 [Acidimicrobiales bacterium]|jgi:hypothetical protein|nr:hypothetical protein [Acidimicrobiales bacterium]